MKNSHPPNPIPNLPPPYQPTQPTPNRHRTEPHQQGIGLNLDFYSQRTRLGEDPVGGWAAAACYDFDMAGFACGTQVRVFVRACVCVCVRVCVLGFGIGGSRCRLAFGGFSFGLDAISMMVMTHSTLSIEAQTTQPHQPPTTPQPPKPNNARAAADHAARLTTSRALAWCTST